MSQSTARELLALAAVVLAGAGFASAFWPRLSGVGRPRETPLIAGMSLAAAVWVLSCQTLLQRGALEPWPVWIVVSMMALTGIALLVVGYRRRALGLVDLARAGFSWVRASTGAILVPVAALAVLPLVLQVNARRDSLISPTAWYYWLLSRSAAEAGRVPAHSIEWGQIIATFDEHRGFVAHTAALHVAGGDPSSLAAAQLTRGLAIVSAVVGLMFLVRVLGASMMGAAAAAFGLIAIGIYSVKLSSLRPESFAYGVVFGAVGLLVLALRHSDWLLATLASVVFVCAEQIHGISATFGLCLVAGSLVAHVVIRNGDRLRTRVLFAAKVTALVVAGSLAAGFVIGTGASAASDLASAASISPNGSDPTYSFFQLSTAGPPLVGEVGFGAPSNRTLLTTGFKQGFVGFDWNVSILAACAVLAAGLLAARLSRSARFVVVFAVVAFVAMLVLSSWLASRWDTYVPRRTGYQRTLQLWFVLVVAVGATLPSYVRRTQAIVGALVLAGAFGAWTASLPRLSVISGLQPTRDDISTAAALPIDPGSTVLANAWTQGFIPLYTHGIGLLDGQAPYLEPELLERANLLLERARAFFASPATTDFPFAEESVDFVLVGRAPYVIGTPSLFPTDVIGLQGDPRLELISATDRIMLFRVRVDAAGNPLSERP